MTQKKNNTAIVAVFSALLVFITYFISINELRNEVSDFSGHVYTYIPLLKGSQGVDGWMAVPYFMWHLSVIALEEFTPIPLEASAALVSCFFAMFGFYVLYWMFDKVAAYYELECGAVQKGFFAFALSMVQPLFMYWFDTTSQYLGQFSINPMHNPTHMCVKPFSLLCLCFAYDILEKVHNPQHKGMFVDIRKSTKKASMLLAVTLLLSCMAKPTFAEMFIPAVGFIMLYEWLKRVIAKDDTAKEYFHKCLNMLLISVPALAYILLQFLAYFIWGGSYGGEGAGLVITKWMQVWRMYTENVAVSMVLGMGFPFFVVLINGVYFVKDNLGRIALVGYMVGVLECALLGEGGGKITHGDFLWPMMSGMTLLWVVAGLRFMVLEERQNKTKAQQVCNHAAWWLLLLYVLFGVIYIYNGLQMP